MTNHWQWNLSFSQHIIETDSASTKVTYVTHHCQERTKSCASFHLSLIKFILKVYVVKIGKLKEKQIYCEYSHSLLMNLLVCVHRLSRWFVPEKVTDVNIGWRFSLGRYSLLNVFQILSAKDMVICQIVQSTKSG